MKSLFNLPATAGLAVLSLYCIQPAFSGTIHEHEANDSPEQANLTSGSNNLLTVFGQASELSDSLDLDYFSFLVTSPGDVLVEGFGKAAGGGLTLDYVTLIINGPNSGFLRHDSSRAPVINLKGLGAGKYHAVVASGLPQPPGTSGSYQVNISGVNGGIVSGTATAAPEPGTLALATSMLPLAVALARRRQKY